MRSDTREVVAAGDVALTLTAVLERELIEPFRRDCPDLVAAARARLGAHSS